MLTKQGNDRRKKETRVKETRVTREWAKKWPDKVAYEKVGIKLSNVAFSSVKRHAHLKHFQYAIWSQSAVFIFRKSLKTKFWIKIAYKQDNFRWTPAEIN